MQYRNDSLEAWLQTNPEISSLTIETSLSQTYQEWLAEFPEGLTVINEAQTMSTSHPATTSSMPY